MISIGALAPRIEAGINVPNAVIAKRDKRNDVTRRIRISTASVSRVGIGHRIKEHKDG